MSDSRNAALKFFDLPNETIWEVLQHLPSSQLLSLMQTDHRHRELAMDSLFRRHDKESRELQRRYLKGLVNDASFPDALKPNETLLKDLAIRGDIEMRLLALTALAQTQAHSNPTEFERTLKLLDIAGLAHRKLYLIMLAKIAKMLGDHQTVDACYAELPSPYKMIHDGTSYYDYLDPEIVAQVKQCLETAMNEAVNTALRCFYISLYSRLGMTSELITLANTNRYDDMTRIYALRELAMIKIPFSEAQLDWNIERLAKYTKLPESLLLRVLDLFKLLMPQLDEKLLRENIPHLLFHALNKDVESTQCLAFEILFMLQKLLSVENREQLFSALVEGVSDDGNERFYPIRNLEAVVPYLNESEKTQLFTFFTSEIKKAPDASKIKADIQSLGNMSPYLSEEQCVAAIKLLIPFLNNTDFRYEASVSINQALPGLNKATKTKIVEGLLIFIKANNYPTSLFLLLRRLIPFMSVTQCEATFQALKEISGSNKEKINLFVALEPHLSSESQTYLRELFLSELKQFNFSELSGALSKRLLQEPQLIDESWATLARPGFDSLVAKSRDFVAATRRPSLKSL